MARPPTRHGRESLSSSEGAHPDASDLRKHDVTELSASSSEAQITEDEFLAKLNKIRRRSLVKIHVSKNNPEMQKQNGITEETVDYSSTNLSKMPSRPSTSDISNTVQITVEKTDELPPRQDNEFSPIREHVVTEKQSKINEESSVSSIRPDRKSAHNRWLQKKLEEDRKQREKLRKEAVDKEQKDIERREQAKKLFERWKQERDEKDRVERKRQQTEEKRKRALMEESNREKKNEAEKSFQAWKRSHLKPRLMTSDETERIKQKEQIKKEAERAFIEW
ncbi:hypothetical protein DICVIV_07572 [Dictyocaulus viviparus]|uniref:Uncharacterized protein n=1 Tax=Dictyocaulus viviparus TaxID=29172 RepID=A0A0D8XRI1_DICVI|nr:hypothetical protein DICVIV_07572 [Dictyocaulus viviparus]